MDDYSKIIDKIEKSNKFTMKMYINLIDEYGMISTVAPLR